MNQFNPAPGKIIRYAEASGPGVRIDSGVYQGFTIPPYYDSMIAKLIVWAEDRPKAINRMKRALWEFQIGGVKTNILFHTVVMNHAQWLAGKYNTSFIPHYSIMDKVKQYVKETAANGSTEKKVAAITAAQAYIASLR